MKKSRILSLVAVLLCAVMLFASCGSAGAAKNASAKKVFGSLAFWSQPENAELTSATKVTALKGIVSNQRGPLVLLRDTTDGYSTYTVYNLETEKTAGSYNESDSIEYDISLDCTANEAYFYTVKRTDTSGSTETCETFLYDDDGNKITSIQNEVSAYIEMDLVKFGNDCYKFSSNGTYSKAFSSVNDLPDLFAASSKCYYAYSDDEKTLMVLDGKMNTVSSFTFPTYANNPFNFVLNNGNILIQYQIKLSDDAEKYDLIDENAAKWNLVQGVVTAKSGALKTVKTGYYYAGGLTIARGILPEWLGDWDLFFSKGIVNVGTAYQIKENRMDKTSLIASIGNDGKVKSILNRFADGQDDWTPITTANGKAYATDLLGRKYLYTSKGACVGEITEMDVFTNNYIVDKDGKKIYSYDLKELYDYGTSNYTYINTLGAELVFSSNDDATTKYYKYTSAGMKLLNENDTYFSLLSSTNNRCYVLRSSGLSSTYAYYNASGTKLTQTEFILSFAASYEGKVLMSGTDAGTTVFYLFK